MARLRLRHRHSPEPADHCDPRGLDYLELEVRQDELATADGCAAIAILIAEALR